MIYPANFEQKIGFDRLREQVAALCTMRAARGKLAEETFSTSAREIGRRLELADQMRLLLDMEHDFPGGEYPDVDHVVAKLRVEGTFLDVGEVVTLHRALSLVGSVVAFILAREGQYPALYARSRGVEAFPGIVQRIDAIVDRFGNIRDNASPALLEIRRAIREREGQAAKRLQAVLAAAKGAGIVDADAQISIREGKAVIPVAAANKRKLQGFIHDESATGRTFYVEPVEVVEINNELRELEYAERREIVRILSEFTDSVRPDAGLIAASGDYLAEIDMLRAKGRWASQNGCVKPIISDDDRLVLKNALAMLTGQGLLVMLAGLLEESTGRISFAWSLVFFVLAGTFIALALWHKYILPRPASDAQRTNITPHTILVEFGNTFVSFFNKKGIVPALLFMLTYRLGESQLVKLASPFLLDGREVGGLALSTGEVGFAYGTVGVISLLLGGVLGGLAISRGGLKTWLWPMALAISLPNLVYLYMAYTMPESIVVVNACVAVEQFGYGFGFTAYTMYLMLFAEGEYKTSHYAISTGFMALGMMLPGMASGWIQEQIGYQHFFIWVMICCIPLFIVLPFLRFKKK